MGFQIKEIQERKQALKLRRQELQEEVLGDVFNTQNIITSLASGIASKWLFPKSKNLIGTENNSFFYNKIVKKDKSGILPTIYKVISNPIISGLLTTTRKSWIKWQLFNLGIFLLKKGIEKYKNRKFQDVEIIQ